MQYNRVMSLSNGTCIKIDNSLTYRVKSITFELEKNKKYEDHINISNVRELNMDGNAYSDNNRVLIKNPIISDKAYNISFTIDTVDLEDGDIISGNISIITNVGNANIPFEYKIITDNLTRAVNNLETITDYYDYFVSDFEGGRTLFIEKRILKARFMQDDFTMSLYEGLIKGSNKDIAIIEFFRAFEIDVINLYKNVNDEIVRRYIDDTLDNIDLDTIKASDDLNKLLTINSKESKEELIKNEILLEASNIIDNLKDKELLIVLASMCVRSNFTDQLSFRVYLKVIEKGSNINGIYDKFLLSIPDDYANKLPLYIYRYYFEDKSYTFDDKAKLYENIIAVFDENEDVYMMFNNEMLEYAISRIYQNRITESLIKIYNKLLNINIINENNCNNILYLLRSHKFVIANTNIKKVIIKYAETEKETKYDVVNNIAYVPIFFDSRVILYEDIYGNRFYNEDVNISILFKKKEIESYIVENYPPSEIIDMTKVIKLNETQTLTREYEVEEIRELENKLNINAVIKENNKNKIIDYYYREILLGNMISDNAKTFLMKFVFGKMNTDDKRKILKIMIECKEYMFVFDKASYYGLNLLDDSDLLALFLKCIDINDETNKARLINDIFSFVKKGNKDIKLLNYLSNNYESSIENMVFVMDKMVECGLDSSYMAKKILLLALESNDTLEIDHVFDNYDEAIDENNPLVIAYLNKKATDYFLDDKETSDEYFSKLTKYLSNHYDDIDTLPIIFLFAITKYISTFRMLSDNNLRRILIKSMERLLKTDYVFAYYKKLNKHVKIPYSIMNKEYIEYHADKDFVPRAIITISGEDDKKTIELTKVFMNIYVKRITVFKNEIINYEIINSSDASNVLAKGTLTYDENYELEYPKYNKMRGTFDYINDAIVCLDRDNIEGLKKVVLEMIEKQEMSKALFNLWS